MSNTTLHHPGVEQSSPYHYIPTFAVCVTYIVLFSISTLIHFGEAIYFKLWWLLPTTVFCGIGEIIGWSGRVWSSKSPLLKLPFLIQISSTILSPTFLVAANFIILGRLIGLIGPQYSRLGPWTYAIVFLTADTIALIIQAIGGAKASAATTFDEAQKGARVMLGGILFQFVAIVFYVTLATEFFIRYNQNRPVRRSNPESNQKSPRPLDRHLKLMSLGLAISTLFIFIRTIYRTIELQNGWDGRIISTQLYFNVLDGMPIVIAMFTMNAFHPGFLLRPSNNVLASSTDALDKEEKLESRESVDVQPEPVS